MLGLSLSVALSKCNPVIFYFVKKKTGDGCEDVARETKMSKGNFGWETDYRIPSQTRAQASMREFTYQVCVLQLCIKSQYATK